MRLRVGKRELEITTGHLMFTATLLTAFLLRVSLFAIESRDYQGYLRNWLEFIEKNGGWRALKHDFSNYGVGYLYFLVLISYFSPPLSSIAAVKIISVAFDFIGACYVYKIVRLRYPTGPTSCVAAAVVLFTPTIVLNSSLWGQSDMIYTAGLLAALYYALKGREGWMSVSFGFALSIKAQAMFLAPFVLWLFCLKKISWRPFFWIAIVFVASLVPAVLIGRPAGEAFSEYLTQFNYYHDLTRNAPNLYQWIPREFYWTFTAGGMAVSLLLAALSSVWLRRADRRVTKSSIIQLALVSALFMPFFLPKMHDRYFFPADVISIIYAFFFPKYFTVALVVCASSLLSYLPALSKMGVFPVKEPVPLAIVAFFILGVLAFVVFQSSRTLLAEEVRGHAPRSDRKQGQSP